MTDLYDDTPSQPVEESQPEDSTDVVDVPDIPMPTEAVDTEIKDTFDGSLKFAVFGAGQGGSRIAEAFWKLGYRKVGVINSAAQDQAAIAIPEENKFLIGNAGAGKDRGAAERMTKEHYEGLLDFMRRCSEGGFDRILLCVGAGGGTGAGSISTLIKVARDLCDSLSMPVQPSPVGVLVALPTKAEGKKVNANAWEVMSSLLITSEDAGPPVVSPLVILDNERIKDIFPGLSVQQFWATANSSISSLFHLFNTISSKETPYTSFDKADLDTVMASGVITFGATPVKKWDTATDISFAIRDNLKRNILAGGMDLSLGNVAACVVVGHKDVLSTIPQEFLEHGFDQLRRILGEGSTVHRGIYQGNKPGLVVYTAIGGLGSPLDRMRELAKLGTVQVEDDLHS